MCLSLSPLPDTQTSHVVRSQMRGIQDLLHQLLKRLRVFFFSQILFLLRRSFLRLYGVWNNLHHICVSRSSAPTSQMPAITFFFWSASILVSALLESSFVRVFSNIFYPSVYPKPFTMSPCSVCVGLWCCEIPPLCIHYYTRSTPLHLLHTLRV